MEKKHFGTVDCIICGKPFKFSFERYLRTTCNLKCTVKLPFPKPPIPTRELLIKLNDFNKSRPDLQNYVPTIEEYEIAVITGIKWSESPAHPHLTNINNSISNKRCNFAK